MGISIRQGVEADFSQVLTLMKEFQAEILEDYGIDLSTLNFEEMSKYIGTSFIAEEEGKIIGIIAGQFIKFPMVGEKIYQETIWFVKRNRRKCGLLLMKTLIAWCKEQGVKFIVTSRIMNFKPESFDALYKKLGFMPYEVNYIKDLSREVVNV